MKKLLLTGLLLYASLSAPAVYAASCAAASSALAGAQAGYEQNRKAAESWSQREKQASNGFQQCLGDISTSITVPTFPDFSQIFDQIKDKICSAARDKVSSLLPGNIDIRGVTWAAAIYRQPTFLSVPGPQKVPPPDGPHRPPHPVPRQPAPLTPSHCSFSCSLLPVRLSGRAATYGYFYEEETCLPSGDG